jgi:hypothetical protein
MMDKRLMLLGVAVKSAGPFCAIKVLLTTDHVKMQLRFQFLCTGKENSVSDVRPPAWLGARTANLPRD